LATGCARLGGAWAWLLIRLGLAMAAWAWLWPLDLAINGYGLVPLGYGGFGLAPLGYWLFLAWHRLGLAISNGYGLAIAAWAWLLVKAIAWQSPNSFNYGTYVVFTRTFHE